MSDSSTTWNMTYNADGLRTKRTNGSTTYNYTYYGGQLAYMSVNGSALYFSIQPDGTPMGISYQGTQYLYVTNLQGDVTAILDTSGNTVVEYTYDAWGNILTTTGSMASTLGELNPLRYRGYVYDRETTLYYINSRYYDPSVGRFVSADALISTGQGLLGNNMYSYFRNNPVCRIDVTGYADNYALSDDFDPDRRVDVGGGCNGSQTVGDGSDGGTTSGTGSSSSGGGAPTGGNAMVGGAKPGEPTDVHHIVERCQAQKSGFSQTDINGSSNLVSIPRGVHRIISGYYSSKQPYTEGSRVRDWLAGKPFDYQHQFGLDQMERAFAEYYGT